MVYELRQNLERNCRDMRPCKSSFGHMTGVTYGGGEHFGADLMNPHDCDELSNDIHPVFADIIETPDKRRQE
jgi:hypothetical protein